MTDILNMRLEDLPEEKPAPVGPYEGVINTHFIREFEPKDGEAEGTKRADVVISGLTPLFEADLANVNLKTSRATKQVWLTANAATQVRRDLTAMGADGSLSIVDALDALKGRRVKFKLKHEVNEKTGKVYLVADNVRALEQVPDAA